jgi:hypothetical protein
MFSKRLIITLSIIFISLGAVAGVASPAERDRPPSGNRVMGATTHPGGSDRCPSYAWHLGKPGVSQQVRGSQPDPHDQLSVANSHARYLISNRTAVNPYFVGTEQIRGSYRGPGYTLYIKTSEPVEY